MSYLSALGTAVPTHRFKQETIAAFMERAMQLDDERSRKLQAIFRASGIHHRHSVLDDYGKTEGFSFYPNNADFEPFPTTHHRIDAFRKHALSLSAQAAQNALEQRPDLDRKQITHLIVVCCTGMYAPGLDIELVNSLSLSSSVSRTCINFMGCYAAFNGIKVADAFCKANPSAKVLLVCTELCSLHFQKENTDDNLLANALFADGSAAAIIEGTAPDGVSLEPTSFHSDLAPEGAGDMAWNVGNLGFEMHLSAYVPGIIESGIVKLTQSLLSKLSKQITDIDYFAIHPGGKKILEVIEKQLGITKTQNAPAYEVLQTYGNMSSPTVLFVLSKILYSLTAGDRDKNILSFAFGPGLTLESMILTVRN